MELIEQPISVDDTNKLFEKPNYYDVRVTEKNSELWAAKIFEKLKDEKK